MKTESHPTSIPFSITPDATDYLRNRLNEMPPDAHPVLMMTSSQTDGLNPPRWRYDGQSFIIGYFDPSENSDLEYTETELLGRRVAIESGALKQLSGRTLGLRRVTSSYGLMKNARYVLVTNSAEPPASTFEGNAPREQTKCALYLAVLTILGGFTGMGVIWIASATVIAILNIPFERLLSLIFPLFVGGCIGGAILSYLFFRSAFKTNGRTQFAQEQKQRKYLGYGGLPAQLDWWIFVGIPIPITGILIFALEPIAHTVEQKTGVAVAAIVATFAASMYFCDRLRRRFVLRLGILGWALTFALGYWYFKTHGP